MILIYLSRVFFLQTMKSRRSSLRHEKAAGSSSHVFSGSVISLNYYHGREAPPCHLVALSEEAKYIMSVLEKGIKILRGGIALSGAAARLLIGAGAAAVLFMGLIKKKKK